MNVSFSIPYPTTRKARSAWNREFGLNAIYAGKHWSARRRDAEYWHTLTVSAMNRHGIGGKPFSKPVSIAFVWDDNLDLSNHAYIGKMIEDALKGRLIVDDDQRYVVEITHRLDRGSGEIKVIVTEIEE